MKEKELLGRLKEKAVFSVQDLERIWGFSGAYAKLVLNRLVKRKEIVRVSKNVYTLQEDVFVVASNIVIPSYISFWSASSYYGFTEQMPNTIYVATTRNARETKFRGYKIKFFRIKNFFGYHKVKTNFGEIFVVNCEKLLIDAIENQKQMGNFDEIVKVFEKAEISKDKVVEYLKRINKRNVIKRVGYLLELIKGIDIYDKFEHCIDRNYVFLNKFSKKYKSLNSKWKVKT